MPLHIAPAAIALALERIFGYPGRLQGLLGHPVEWMGHLLIWLEQQFYDADAAPEALRLRGVATLLCLAAATALAAYGVAALCGALPFAWIWEAAIASTLLAQNSLDAHVSAAAAGLRRSLVDGRDAVSRIVGRDPQSLDESGVANAALESLAENTSDGVVAPLLYFVLFGLPGIAIYKAINTADSMIGHKNDRYLHFGWAAARLDDLVNLPASRLTGLLFAAAAAWEDRTAAWRALRAMSSDARHHRSPNAGWPEAALAGVLGIALGGPRAYGGKTIDLPRMGDGRANLTADDIIRGLKLYRATLTLILIVIVVCALLF
jgi:adenosylcobinamide-phosphate synthase